MTKTFKKGDQVYYISSWDDKGTFTMRKAQVESWGKRQATLFCRETNKMFTSRIYVEHVGTDVDDLADTFKHEYVLPVTGDRDIVHAHNIAKRYIALCMANRVNALEYHRQDANDRYVKYLEQEIENVKNFTPRAITYTMALEENRLKREQQK